MPRPNHPNVSNSITFSLPYKERAAIALIQGSVRYNRLQSVIEPEISSSELIDNYGLGARRLSTKSASRIVRKISNASHSRRLAINGMHIGKILFDRSVPKSTAATSIAFGFPGASKSFFTATADSTMRVLHAVDAHPLAHNDALLNVYSRAQCRAELYPSWLVARIEAELDMASRILVPSNLVREQMLRHGVSASKLTLQPYGCEFSVFSPPTGLAQQDSATRLLRLLYVGQISMRKGIGHLIEAVRGLNVELRMVGNAFDGSLLKDLPSNVRAIKPQSHKELAAYYHWADAFVLPTVEDACSLVALEAAAAGLPIVTTSMNGATEILNPDQLIMVTPGSVKELSSSINSLNTLDPEVRRSSSRKARQHGLRSWDDYASATLADMQHQE